MPNGTGIGIWKEGALYGESLSLGCSPSVFQAEIIAIQTYAEEIVTSSHWNEAVEILSDSQGALKALEAVKFDSVVVLNCYRKLNSVVVLNCYRKLKGDNWWNFTALR
ncbi:hypothetical protein QE152_g1147 [Popillia japonica]|uniref:RNase H type-1 domain-containing protein n=1 Tax=Popillia japonica TaxID=7064 RepID=A0AAW1N3Z1_POPJA